MAGFRKNALTESSVFPAGFMNKAMRPDPLIWLDAFICNPAKKKQTGILSEFRSVDWIVL